MGPTVGVRPFLHCSMSELLLSVSEHSYITSEPIFDPPHSISSFKDVAPQDMAAGHSLVSPMHDHMLQHPPALLQCRGTLELWLACLNIQMLAGPYDEHGLYACAHAQADKQAYASACMSGLRTFLFLEWPLAVYAGSGSAFMHKRVCPCALTRKPTCTHYFVSCACACARACAHTHVKAFSVRACACAHTQLYARARTRASAQAHTHAHAHTHRRSWDRTYTHRDMRTHTHIHTLRIMQLDTYIRTGMHMQTHARAHS